MSFWREKKIPGYPKFSIFFNLVSIMLLAKGYTVTTLFMHSLSVAWRVNFLRVLWQARLPAGWSA